MSQRHGPHDTHSVGLELAETLLGVSFSGKIEVILLIGYNYTGNIVPGTFQAF